MSACSASGHRRHCGAVLIRALASIPVFGAYVMLGAFRKRIAMSCWGIGFLAPVREILDCRLR